MKEPTIICQNIQKSFAGQPVVRGLDFTVAQGAILALLGPSGCGKTTTLRLIAGFERLDVGHIEVAGRIVANERIYTPPEKRHVGVVFQDYAIFPHLSVAQNVAFGLGRGQQKNQRVAEILALVGLEGQGEKMPHQMSGGQQQRVALARALAPQPDVLLLDEPFSNLDAALRESVRQEVRELLKRSGTTAVFVTHDQEEALALGDEVAVMVNGRIEQIGTPEAIFHQPQTRFVAEFMGQTDFISGITTNQGVDTPLGTMSQLLDLPNGTQVEIAVRSDDVQLMTDEKGNGTILSRQFVGIANIYRVGLPDGTIVHSWAAHTTNLSAGTTVHVRLGDEHALACFYDGQLVHTKR
ncbi:MAG: ABC transporter ATP-binding protein [Chloroflexi bacterium]|nr:ABC transporter ATP-binding protein [Chloroflexota bacterium]